MARGPETTIAMACVLGLAGLIFDILLPLGVAGGVPYVALVLIGLWAPRRGYAFALAGVGTLLTVVGYFASPEGANSGVVLTNRGLALFAIWVTALLIVAFRARDEALRQSERRFEAIFEAAPIPLFVSRISDGVVIYANAASVRLFGFSLEELIGRRGEGLWYRPAEGREWWERLQQEGQVSKLETRARKADGTPIWVAGSIKTLVFDGEPAAVTGILDITERKRAEEKSRKLSWAVEQSPASVIIADKAGRIEYVNPKFIEVTGYSAEEVIGQNPRFLKSGHTTPEEYEDLWKTISSGGTWRGEFHNRKKSGELFWEAASISPVRATDGTVTHYVGVKLDITERKRAEQELLDHKRQLERQHRELQDMMHVLSLARDQAEAASRAKSVFLANMSHELRTPLNAIIGFSEMIAQGVLGPVGDARYIEYAGDISSSGQHLLNLINDILDLSKIEAGKLEPNDKVIAVQGAIDACLHLIKEGPRNSEVVLERRIPEGLPALRADERMLKQILLNLFTNAVKFTPAGGTVTVAAAVEADGGLAITVSDSGIGIAPEDMATALAPFGQVDSSLNRKFEGTGLGLPLIKSLIELHGGSLEIDSEVGVGTVVTVRFPPARVVDWTDEAAADDASRRSTRHLAN